MEVILSKLAIKELNKMNNNTRMRILIGIEGLKEKPPKGDIKVLKGYKGTSRLRIGTYRTIYEILEDKINIIDIGSRGDIYK